MNLDDQHKEFSKLMAHEHRVSGRSAFLITDPMPGDTLVNISNQPLTVGGKRIRERIHIRGFLFRVRQHPAMFRPGTVVWSVYDPVKKVSMIGLASIVRKDLLEVFA